MNNWVTKMNIPTDCADMRQNSIFLVAIVTVASRYRAMCHMNKWLLHLGDTIPIAYPVLRIVPVCGNDRGSLLQFDWSLNQPMNAQDSFIEYLVVSLEKQLLFVCLFV